MSNNGKVNFMLAVVLKSPDPDRLAHFYRDLLGLPLKPFERGNIRQPYACEIGDMHFAIERAEVPSCSSGHTMLAFAVPDIHAALDRLRAHNIPVPVAPEPFGENSLQVTGQDPDGNPVRLVQVDFEWIQFLEERRKVGLDSVERWKASHFS